MEAGSGSASTVAPSRIVAGAWRPGSARVRHARESIEVSNAPRPRCECDFSGALGQWSHEIRKIAGVRQHLERIWSCAVRGERKRLSGTPVKNAAQLPTLDQTGYPSWRVAKQQPIRPERQLKGAIATDILCALERL